MAAAARMPVAAKLQINNSKGFIGNAKVNRRTVLSRFQRNTSVRVNAEKAPEAGRKRVIAVGETLFDLIADQRGLPRDKVQSWTPYAGGAAANVATSLGRLGLDVLFVTALGRDERGEALFNLLKSCGVKMDAVQRRDEPTRDVYVVQDNNGDREFAGFGLASHLYCDCFLSEAALPVQELRDSAMVVTGTLGLAQPRSRDTFKKAVQIAREGGSKLLVDVNWRPVFWEDQQLARQEITEYLKQADLIKISDADLQWLLGMDATTALNNPCAVAAAFPDAYGVLVTAGEKGAAYCFKSATKGENAGFIPCFQVDVVETTGAGDAFTAGFIGEMLEVGGLDALVADPDKLREAVLLASAAGALTCTKKGAIGGQPSFEEVVALVARSRQQQQQ